MTNGHTVVSDSEATESEDEGANTLGFAIFALRDLKAREEVVLGWEWDDGSVVHKLPALVEMGDGKRGEGPSKLTCVSFFLNLTHVSSRQLAGLPLTSYTKSAVTYSNLSASDVERMEKDGEVDAWVMALPNGACKPFVDAVDRGTKERKGDGSIVVDLSADYRFESGWTYGLPGEH